MAATACERDDLDLEAQETLRWYTPKEETTVQYGFCNHCGGTLFWKSENRPGWLSICAGSLDTPTGLRTEEALFVAEASDYHVLDESLRSWPHDH